MGIRFTCPNGHKLHVKEFLAGKRGICPTCGAKFVIPQADEPQAEVNVPAGGTAKPLQTRPQADLSSPSMIIPLVEPSRAPLRPATAFAPPSEMRPDSTPLATTPAAQAPQAAVEPSSPALAEIAITPAKPVVNRPPAVAKYVAHRTRSRRNQVRIAIALVIAVILLAVILIWVLTQNAAVSARPLSGPIADACSSDTVSALAASRSISQRSRHMT